VKGGVLLFAQSRSTRHRVLRKLDLELHSTDWTTLDDGHQALLVDGAGFDGGSGAFFVNHGDDLHAVGSLAPIIDGYVGCVVIRPDGR